MKWEHLLITAFILFIGYLFYLIIYPFWAPILWAIVLTVLFHPVYIRLKGTLKDRESIASLLSCLIIFIMLTIPVGFLLTVFAREVIEVYKYIEVYLLQEDISFLDRIKDLPLVSTILEGFG